MREEPWSQRFLEHRSCRALVATENPLVRGFVTEALSRAEYRVDACDSDRNEILERCGTTPPFFLILEVTPGRLNEFELVLELRARGASFPVIFLSAGPRPEAAALGIESLSLPFTLESLQLTIDRAFTRLSLAQLSLEGPESAASRSDGSTGP